MSQYAFGAGSFWGTPLTDANGNAIATPTPVQLGVMQDFSLDISFDTKMLYGQLQFPVAVGRGKGKMSGKAKHANLNGAAINSLVFGQTMTSGLVDDVYDVVGANVPASSPFTISPAIPNSGTYAYDLGVRDANGIPMTRVTGTPTTGQYALAAGVYTFAAADAGKQMFLSYQFTATSATAKKMTIANLPMGQAPTFKGDFYTKYGGKQLVITIPLCISSKFTFSTKQDDFMVPEIDFEGFADSAGNACYMALGE